LASPSIWVTGCYAATIEDFNIDALYELDTSYLFNDFAYRFVRPATIGVRGCVAEEMTDTLVADSGSSRFGEKSSGGRDPIGKRRNLVDCNRWGRRVPGVEQRISKSRTDVVLLRCFGRLSVSFGAIHPGDDVGKELGILSELVMKYDGLSVTVLEQRQVQPLELCKLRTFEAWY